MSENNFLVILASIYLLASVIFAIPLAISFAKIQNNSKRKFRNFVLLQIVSFIECVAFVFGMATQIFTILLGVVWGLFLGRRLRKRTDWRKAYRISLAFSLFSCLPTAVLSITVPIVRMFLGGNIIDTQQGLAFGIPSFFPWPLNTILGFYFFLLIGTLILKTAITISAVYQSFKCKKRR